MENINFTVAGESIMLKKMLEKSFSGDKQEVSRNSRFRHYKDTHFNLLKEDITRMRLVKKKDNFYSLSYFMLSILFFIVFFDLNFFSTSILIGSNLIFLKIFKVYNYELLIYYKNAGFTKISIRKKEVSEVELLIKYFK